MGSTVVSSEMTLPKNNTGFVFLQVGRCLDVALNVCYGDGRVILCVRVSSDWIRICHNCKQKSLGKVMEELHETVCVCAGRDSPTSVHTRSHIYRSVTGFDGLVVWSLCIYGIANQR